LQIERTDSYYIKTNISLLVINSIFNEYYIVLLYIMDIMELFSKNVIYNL